MVYICSKISVINNTELLKIDLQETTSTTVDKLYQSVSAKLGPTTEQFNLVCYGRILEPKNTLAHYGIRDSSVVYAYKKPEIKLPSNSTGTGNEQAEGIDPRELTLTYIPIKTAINQPEFISLIEKLKESRENRENLFSVTPGMSEDPVAMAILQDIDLLYVCLLPENLHKVMNKFPSLLFAAACLAEQYHEEHRTPGGTLFQRTGTRRFGYSMDEMDDYDGPENTNDANGPPSEAGAASAQADSTALRELLSQALIMANQSNNASAQNVRPPTSNIPVRPIESSVRPPITSQITPQMLQNALQSVTSNLPSQAPPPAQPQPPPRRDWSRELEQMREMGLTDERLCIEALEATSGNVDAAVNLIFANQ